ncbi:hypothetical protein SDC9_194780 [bioreactor metagenome]|uniref:Uncharacterized protein n=1 Tax=bioreactor metagenome TaxID=1076179 RepID=A0A645I9S7_9ZZZZ
MFKDTRNQNVFPVANGINLKFFARKESIDHDRLIGFR